MKKVLLVIVIVIVILILGAVLVLGYFGLVPGVSSLFGSDKPRDLGVTWTPADYTQAHAQTGVEVKVSEGNPVAAQSIISTGSHSAKLNLTGTELTAVINNNSGNWKYFPISDVQLKMNADGSAQMSGMLYLNRLAGYTAATGASYADVETVMGYFKLLPEKIPFYVTGTPSITNNVANLNLASAELGRIPVPQNLISDNTGAINNFFTAQINAFPGFSAKSANFAGGALNFDGTLADKVETFK
jgi:hypothetical protein